MPCKASLDPLTEGMAPLGAWKCSLGARGARAQASYRRILEELQGNMEKSGQEYDFGPWKKWKIMCLRHEKSMVSLVFQALNGMGFAGLKTRNFLISNSLGQ